MSNDMSKRDQQILGLLFNPEATFESLDTIENESAQIDQEKLKELSAIEIRAIDLAEKNQLNEALVLLNEIIDKEPKYASAYNNRAQLLRLLNKQEEARSDVELALKYGEGNPSVLKQAYTQRAILKKSAGDAEGADLDFAKAASFGNVLAKHMVKQNPYAKLCNAMVTEMLAEYKK